MTRSLFDSAYESQSGPWIIGEPQPAIIKLERDGWIRGAVLDPGCGTGEHTVYLTRRGYTVRGVDFSPLAIEQARANAERHQVTARLDVADAMDLGDEPRYDTVVDSALFHVFEPADRLAYTRSPHAVHEARRTGARARPESQTAQNRDQCPTMASRTA